MLKIVSSNEVDGGWGDVLGDVAEGGDEVIVERDGRPTAVVIPFAAYEELRALREGRRRADALERLRSLRDAVRARNQDLSEEQAEAIADRFAHELIDDLASKGVVRFARDRHPS